MRPDWDRTFMDIADTYARRSRCVRRQVGAVITSQSNEQIAAGYNGPPATWRGGIHGLLAGQSCDQFCPRAGSIPFSRAVIHEPYGWDTVVEPTPGATYDNCITIHAEMNALLRVDRRDLMIGGTVYISTSSCWDCAKVLSNTYLSRVVMRLDPVADAHRGPDRVVALLRKCDKDVVIWES